MKNKFLNSVVLSLFLLYTPINSVQNNEKQFTSETNNQKESVEINATAYDFIEEIVRFKYEQMNLLEERVGNCMSKTIDKRKAEAGFIRFINENEYLMGDFIASVKRNCYEEESLRFFNH